MLFGISAKKYKKIFAVRKVDWQVTLVSLVSYRHNTEPITEALKLQRRKVWINEAHMTDSVLWSINYRSTPYAWKLFLDCPWSRSRHAAVTENQTCGAQYIWKSLCVHIICLILCFIYPFPPSSLSCQPWGCVSSVVLASWCRVVPAVGRVTITNPHCYSSRSNYYNYIFTKYRYDMQWCSCAEFSRSGLLPDTFLFCLKYW